MRDYAIQVVFYAVFFLSRTSLSGPFYSNKWQKAPINTGIFTKSWESSIETKKKYKIKSI